MSLSFYCEFGAWESKLNQWQQYWQEGLQLPRLFYSRGSLVFDPQSISCLVFCGTVKLTASGRF
jgi:hypothetical protein